MDVQSARTLFAYNRWANRWLLEEAGKLTPDELDRDLRGSFGSIKGTLRHLLWAERSWLRFWQKESFGSDLAATEFPDLPSIVAAWSALEDEKDALARALTEESLGERRDVDEDSYVLGELIQHAVNHSTHHRGQVVLMLRQLGKTPPNTGFRQFLTASRQNG